MFEPTTQQRKEFQLTDEQLDRIMKAIQSVPLILIGGRSPPTQQARANTVWCSLGDEIGFEGMSVRPSAAHPDNPLFFTAIPKEPAGGKRKDSP